MASRELWRLTTTRHVGLLYFVGFCLHAYQCFEPYVTYDRVGELEDITEWARFLLLTLAGAIVPLLMPRSCSPSVSEAVVTSSVFADYWTKDSRWNFEP